MSASEKPPDHEVTRDELARVIMGARAKQLRERVKSLDLQGDRLYDTFKEARREGDRAAAILIFAYIDDIMAETYRRELAPDIPGGLKTLLEGLGPLATADARLRLALALRWIRRETFDDINYIRRIRNVFAHRAAIRDFAHGDPWNLIANISEREVAVYKSTLVDSRAAPELLSPRDRFLVRAALTCAALVQDLAIMTTAVAMGESPQLYSFEQLEPTENIHEALLRVADVLLLVWPTEPRRSPPNRHTSGESNLMPRSESELD